MAFCTTDSDCTDIDDEIFFGKLTLKEAKKHIFLGRQRQTISYTTKLHEDDNDASIRIIETHSAPDIGPNIHAEPPIANKKSMSNLDISPNNVPSKWNISVSDESFLKMERLVTELCMSPKKEELDSKIDIDLTNHDSISSDNTSDSMTVSQKPSQFEADKINVLDVNSYKTPVKQSNCVPRTPHSAYLTSKTSRPDAYATPSTGSKTPFKTPGNPVHKKTTYTPSKKPFQHVMSPVAFYINSCTQVPLVKNVQPKKLLPGTSSIPKLVKSTPKTNLCNKENVSLPSIAYRSAKETKVINVPDEHKLPKSNWTKQLVSSIPKAVVMKHEHREISSKKLFHHQDESYADLSLQQADVSVCTQKSAFKKPK